VRRYWLMKGTAAVVLIPAFVAAVSFVVMLLWNALVSQPVRRTRARILAGRGIARVVPAILFGGFRGTTAITAGSTGRGANAGHRMTPEERDRFPRWHPQVARHEPRGTAGISPGGFRGCGGGMVDESSEPKGV